MGQTHTHRYMQPLLELIQEGTRQRVQLGPPARAPDRGQQPGPTADLLERDAGRKGFAVGIVVLVAHVHAMALAPGASVQLMVAVMLLVGYAFVLLALIAGGSHFRKNYPGR